MFPKVRMEFKGCGLTKKHFLYFHPNPWGTFRMLHFPMFTFFPKVKIFSEIPPADVHFWDDAACLKGLQELDIEEDGSKDGSF